MTIPLLYAAAAAVLGIASVILWFAGIAYGAVGLGGVGLFLGSYSMTRGGKSAIGNKMLILVIAGVAVLTSVIGFIMGIYDL